MNNDIVDFVFRHEVEIKQAIYEKRNDRGGKTGGNGSGHSRISDPTAMEAIHHVEEVRLVIIEYGTAVMGRRESYKLRYPERWLKAIDYARYGLGTLERDVLKAHYNNEKWYATCDRLFISQNTYYSILREIKHAARNIAIGMELIAVKNSRDDVL